MAVGTEQPTEQDVKLLYECARIARESRQVGNHPFGALLADAYGTILLEQGNEVNSDNNDCAHAETLLAMRSSRTFDRKFLASCTLYTSIEPCAMCSGAIYWANIGAVVYGLSEGRLLELTGSNQENPTMDLSCRTVFGHGQKPIVVRGPAIDPELEKRIIEDHLGFWD